MKLLHINEVKKISGVSVRTLRYYDQMNLLKPISKTEGGHRLYSSIELKKLQQIQFLKTIGFQLKEIKKMLDSEEWDWSSSLMKQLSYVKAQKDDLTEIEFNLRELINGVVIDGEDFRIKKLMDLYSKKSRNIPPYDKADLRIRNAEVLNKLPKMSSTDADSLEWIALIGQLNKHMKLGYSHSRIQNIIRRMDEKRLEDFGGEDDFLDELWKIRMSPQASDNYNLYPIDQKVLDFMQQAYNHYLEKI